MRPRDTKSPALIAGWALVELMALIILASCLALLVAGGFEVAAVRMVIRATARSSLILFLLAFSASAIHRLWPSPWSRWQLANRRYLGLSFAFSHALHAAAVISFARMAPGQFHEATNIVTYLAGGFAYLVIIAMTVTSFAAAARAIGPSAWRRLHTLGAYDIWLTFLFSEAKRAVHDPSYWLWVALLLGALGVRLAAALYARAPARRMG